MPARRCVSDRRFDVRGDSLVTLAGGGNLRVARASAIEVMAANAVRLERGELYVDIPPGSRGSDRFVVVTPAGEFRHLGTQFAVAIVDGRRACACAKAACCGARPRVIPR